LIVVTPSGAVSEWGGHDEDTTNNRMELMGCYRGLQKVYQLAPQFPNARKLRIISDSKYVLEGAQFNVHAWSKNGWKTQAKTEVKNQELWEKILKGLQHLKELGFQFQYELVKGHSGHEGNDRVDQIAVNFSKKVPQELYQGSLSEYSVSLEAKAPFKTVYLCYLSGKLTRYLTWDECKKAVEGQKAVKYKKVTNALQERETLKLWGIDG
jgi:ribonuclease HI